MFQLLLVIAVAAGLYWFFTRRNAEEDFKRAQEAMKSVKSWRARTVSGEGTARDETLREQQCPASYHITRRVSGSAAGEAIGMATEEIQVGENVYYRNPATRAWAQGGRVEYPGKTCSDLAGGFDADSFPPLTEMLRRGMISQGGVETVDGARRREWNVQMVSPLGTRKEMVCLGVDDFLVRKWRVESTETTYFDYNKPISISAPSVVETGYPE